jgi:hypothetical protein
MLHNFFKLNFLYAIFFSVFYSVNNLNDWCATNLDCSSTTCCKNKKCVDNDACKQDMIKVYIAVGLVGVFFLILSLIYFFISIKEIRENVKRIKMESKNENKTNLHNDSKVINDNHIQQLELKNMQATSNKVAQFS